MKKIWLLISLLSCGLLLTWCNSTKDNNLVSLCEEKAKNLNCESNFIRDWTIQSWDETILYWMRYSVNKPWEFLSDESVECHFDNKWNFKWVRKNWRVFTPNNIANSDMMKPWWYLYKNLDLTKEEDKAEYEQLQNDKNMILKYQTDTSTAVNKFIDIIRDDLLKSCELYWTGYETMTWTMYERDVCVDNYISDLYEKLKAELNNPRIVYLWNDPVLLSYYNDLNWDHPFVRYFVDLYTEIKDWLWDYGPLPEYPNIWPITQFENWDYWGDESKWSELVEKYWTGFYTYWAGNIMIDWIEETSDVITSIASWIVINWQMLERVKSEYWYTFPIYNDDIMYWTSPMDWPILLHIRDKYGRDFIYQILWAWGGSWEFHFIIRILENWKRIPVWQCGKYWYVLFPRYPILFWYNDFWHNDNQYKQWTCEKRETFDPLTIFTQEYNLYEWNDVQWMAHNFTFFLRALESVRVLNK